MPAHSDDVLVHGIQLGQALAQAADQGVDGLLADALLDRLGPDLAHYLVTGDHTALGVLQQRQQAILSWGQGWIEHLILNEHLARVVVDPQVPSGRRLGRNVKHQRCGLAGIHKGQLEAQGNLHLVAILQHGWARPAPDH